MRLPKCTLSAVFVADATIFRDVQGNVREEQHYYDGFLCLRGQKAHDEVLRSVRTKQGSTYVVDDSEFAELNGDIVDETVDEPSLNVDDRCTMFAPPDSSQDMFDDDYDDIQEAAVYGSIISGQAPGDMDALIAETSAGSASETDEHDTPQVVYTVHTRGWQGSLCLNFRKKQQFLFYNLILILSSINMSTATKGSAATTMCLQRRTKPCECYKRKS